MIGGSLLTCTISPTIGNSKIIAIQAHLLFVVFEIAYPMMMFEAVEMKPYGMERRVVLNAENPKDLMMVVDCRGRGDDKRNSAGG